MTFQEADEFNAAHGTQFIADLMPKTPIYTAMLAESARQVLGVPHPSGRAAMKMLEREGFAADGYVDIFDGGPTMSVATDQIRTIRESREFRLADEPSAGDGPTSLLAAGRLHDFVACYGRLRAGEAGNAVIDADSAALLGIAPGDPFLAVTR